MKKTYKWILIESINVRCPHCGSWEEEDGVFDVGDEIKCRHCRKVFELGEPK